MVIAVHSLVDVQASPVDPPPESTLMPRRLLSVNRSDRPRQQYQAEQTTGKGVEPPAPKIRGLFQRMSIEG